MSLASQSICSSPNDEHVKSTGRPQTRAEVTPSRLGHTSASWVLLKLLPGAIIAALLALAPQQHRDGISDDLTKKLRSYGVPEGQHRVSFIDDLGTPEYGAFDVPDTTAIILNWSRLENVILLSTLLCGPWLKSVIAQVTIWNNNPGVPLDESVGPTLIDVRSFLLTLTSKSFVGTGCSSQRLRIINSPENLLFQARFLACADANTPYCFFQVNLYIILISHPFNATLGR